MDIGTSSHQVDASYYDVFLSFRGKDTRDAFTDHLYETLKRTTTLQVFRDDDEIEKGRGLKPEIEKAIRISKASIVVLSENYAESTWCLDELSLILEQRKVGHRVFPIFYHVNPSDFRKQEGTFEIAVKPSGRWTYDNVIRWKAAFTKVADLSGFHIISGSETRFLKDVIEKVYKELDDNIVSLPCGLIGMKTRYEDIDSLLNQSDLKYLVIYGMGGSGKTTLVKYIYNSNRKFFDNKSFVEDIGRGCKERCDFMCQLQEQLLNDISWGRERKIPSISHGTPKIEDALRMKKTLIVLDDISEKKQLVDLLGCGEINAQSKVIITTINPDIWNNFSSNFSSSVCQKIEMKLLNNNESLELLNRCAFGTEIPTEDFNDLQVQMVEYCGGNPLALEVLGSSLFERNTLEQWKGQLRLFSMDMNDRIQEVLKRGYDLLPYNSEKELFLHIACFFIGKDMEYVVKILEPDYHAKTGIETLFNRRLLSVSSSNKLMMHRLLQEMGRNVVRQESFRLPLKRSRVWLSSDSYKILEKRKGSETIIGLTLDMKVLRKEEEEEKSSELKTDAFEMMDNLTLLQLNYVQLVGFYENFSADLRWLCWFGFNLREIPPGLYMGMRNMVALDMSYSKLEKFDPPMVLKSLKILNLKDSHNLCEIRNIHKKIPRLEDLILWNCHNLVRVCETIGNLEHLTLLNMTGCLNLYKSEQINMLLGLQASTSGGVTKQSPFSLPHSLRRLFLNDCNLDSFPLSFDFQPYLKYLNLSNGLFEFIPKFFFVRLIKLRVLDLSFCERLKCLECLPDTLAELYIYYCKSLVKVTFRSQQYKLQDIGYEGCINLAEIEGFFELVPIAELDETDMGHLKWLKKYQKYMVPLVGDDELTTGRRSDVQMLREFNIKSTSLPDIKDPNMSPEYISESPSLSFCVPSCPKNKRRKGLNVTLKYTLSGDDWAWFATIRTNNGVDLKYNPKVFGRPISDENGTWLSYWPIGNTLNDGDEVNISIIVLSGLEVRECGASIVYADDEEVDETLEINMGLVETLGRDFSGFQLSTGAYYLCRRDFFELMDVGRLTHDWFRDLFGINYTEVQGWGKTGRPKLSYPSYTALKTVRCIIHGPGEEEIYKMAKMSKSSLVDKNVDFISSLSGTIGSVISEKLTKRTIRADHHSRDSITADSPSQPAILTTDDPSQLSILTADDPSQPAILTTGDPHRSSPFTTVHHRRWQALPIDRRFQPTDGSSYIDSE